MGGINLTKGQKYIILSMMSVVIILLSCIIIFDSGNASSGGSNITGREPMKTGNTRTVMMYIDGSNLESDSGIVSADLASIDPSQIDLENTNILIYTGGTKQWHNFVMNDENAIYVLKNTGFEKVQSLQKKNMGDPDTLSGFINYAYENYKADNYNLVLYDHGGAIDGAIYDDFTGDHLELIDIATALNNSPFNENNRLQTILFRTCLNGTLEVATVFSKYADYMIASEEITWGSRQSSVLNFLNGLPANANGIEFGKKYIDSYQKQMEKIDPFGELIVTYSITDLGIVSKVNEKLNEFFKGVNPSDNYASIAKIRAALLQYGGDIKEYDTVDLYDLIENVKHLNPNKGKELLRLLNKAIIKNHTNTKTSHGLSIYFPYNGIQYAREKYLNVYSRVNSLKDYGNFITSFERMKSSAKSYSFNLSTNKTKVDFDKDIIEFQLTKEQSEVYSKAVFMLFDKNQKHEGYYRPLYSTDNIKYENGKLTVNLKNKLIRDADKDGIYLLHVERVNGEKSNLTMTTLLVDNDEDILAGMDTYMKQATLYITNENNTPKISLATLNSKNEIANGTVIDLNEIEYIDIFTSPYEIVDEKGRYISDWGQAPILSYMKYKTSELKLKWDSLDDKGDYYGIFSIVDMNGHNYYSDFIKVGELSE